MPSTPQINYLSRDFNSISADLEAFLKAFYPDDWKDFNVASVGMALVDINAYVSDLLSFIADKKYNENYLDGVQERKSAYRLAKTLGYKPPGFRPSSTVADIFVEVPPAGDVPDPSYIPVIRAGMQVRGGGQTFETTDDIDFSSDFSEDGIANRTIEPIFNANQDILRYRIVKREKIKAGITKIYSQEITEEQAIPFFNLVLPERNVLDILSVIVIPELGITSTPSFQQFNDENLRYFEVDELPEDKIFVKDSTLPTVNGIASGKLMTVEKRFSKDFLADGSCKLQFGGGSFSQDAYQDYLNDFTSLSGGTISIQDVLDNPALGRTVPPNSTIFVKYRVGGGILSNVGANVLQEVGAINAVIDGTNETLNQGVITSVGANNPIPAVGGETLPTVDEVVQNIAGSFAAQRRAVTLRDYISFVKQMPNKFGGVFKCFGKVEDNKVLIYVITRDGNGKLRSSSTSVVKANIQEWLTQFRMINDFVEINDGQVINLQVEADLFVDKTFNPNEVKLNAINEIKKFFDVTKMEMNETVYISQITDILREVPGVINVVELRFYNMESGQYSSTLTSQATGVRTQVLGTSSYRTQIEPIDNSIFGTPISMFEIKFPEKDVRVRTA